MKSLLVVSLIASLAFVNAPQQEKISIAEEVLNGDSADVLKEVKDVNARLPLSNDFRQGHVSNYTYADYLTKTDDGFIIKLPATNNVPTPTWHNGNIYVSGGFGSKEFFSFNAETGEANWAVHLDDDGPSSAVIDQDIAVFNSESCTIFACDINTGEQLWSYWLGDPLMSTPTIDNGIVFSSYPCGGGYINNMNYNDENSNALPHIDTENDAPQAPGYTANYSHAIIAFELKTGKILWQKRIEGDVMSAPVAENNELHVVTFAGTYYVMDEQTGEFKSAKRCRATSAPVFADGKAFFSMRADREGEAVSELITGYDINAQQVEYQSDPKIALYLDKEVQRSAKLKGESMSDDAGNGFGGGAPSSANWGVAYENIGQSNVSSLQNFYGSRVLNTGENNYSMMGDTLICMDMQTGDELWKFSIAGDLKKEGGYLATSPIAAGNYIITATLTGEVLLMDKTKGEVVKKYQVNEPVRSQPIAMNGWVYVTTIYGKLVAINTGDASVTGWPMLGADQQHSNKVS